LELIERNWHDRLASAPAPSRQWRHRVDSAEEASMQWQTPKLVEIACGCEINAYFPADL
jgi:coenzyme PQQ precursor peptide PqqA